VDEETARISCLRWETCRQTQAGYSREPEGVQRPATVRKYWMCHLLAASSSDFVASFVTSAVSGTIKTDIAAANELA